MLKPRPYQREAIDALHRYLETKKGNPILVCPTGCHAKGTKVILYDGSTKAVEDISIGDFLLGPDGTPRIVMRLYRGIDQMFKITPKKGDPFVVNGGHILALKATNEGKGKRGTVTKGNVGFVAVSEYLNKSKYWKHLRKLYRSKEIEFKKRDDPKIDPWALGVLLGDGSLGYDSVSITCGNIETVENFASFAESLGFERKIKDCRPERECWKVAVTGDRGSGKNALVSLLEFYGLRVGSADKFIPDDYLSGSADVRKNILAGLLDTDGHLSENGGFDFISKSENLARGVVFLARSLGLPASISPCKKGCQNGFIGDYWRTYIGGCVEKIPTRVKKKQAKPRRQKKNPLVSGFSIERVNDGEFFGFELDGDHLYLTDDFFVHHNSGKSLIQAQFIREVLDQWPNEKILCVTHVKELIRQNARELLNIWPQADVGIYSAGLKRRELGNSITFAGVQSIYNKAKQLGDVSLMLVDEVHLTNKTGVGRYATLIKGLKEINPYLRIIGLTATPYRLNGGLLTQGEGRIFTDIAHDIPVNSLVPEYLSPLRGKSGSIKADLSRVHVRGGEFIEGEASDAMLQIVDQACADIVARCSDRKKWLIFCCGIEHAEAVTQKLCDLGIVADCVHGKRTTEDRDRILKDFACGKIKAICNIGVLTTGYNQPDLDALVMLRPTMSTALFVQMAGRGARKAEGKENCLILDYAQNIERHGPIAEINIRTGKAEKLRTKECTQCFEIVLAAKKECPDCGFAFPKECMECGELYDRSLDECPGCGKRKAERIARHETKAAEIDDVVGSRKYVDVCDVEQVQYAIHKKPGRPNSLKVTYRCGLQSYSEWICFEHEGYAKEKAHRWWKERTSEPAPETVAAALMLSPKLRTPKSVTVKLTGDYPEIASCSFDRVMTQAGNESETTIGKPLA